MAGGWSKIPSRIARRSIAELCRDRHALAAPQRQSRRYGDRDVAVRRLRRAGANAIAFYIASATVAEVAIAVEPGAAEEPNIAAESCIAIAVESRTAVESRIAIEPGAAIACNPPGD